MAAEQHPCLICWRHATDSLMCNSCQRSYDRTARRDGSVLEAMLWAANRAWRERKKVTRGS